MKNSWAWVSKNENYIGVITCVACGNELFTQNFQEMKFYTKDCVSFTDNIGRTTLNPSPLNE
jgi:hypothetical protein